MELGLSESGGIASACFFASGSAKSNLAYVNEQNQTSGAAMSNFILTQSSVITCPHGGIVTHVPSYFGNYRVDNEIPMLLTDQYIINGCSMALPGGLMTPDPCLRIQWLTGSNFLFVRGIPALTNASTGICQSSRGIPAGPPIMCSFQTAVREPKKFTRVD